MYGNVGRLREAVRGLRMDCLSLNAEPGKEWVLVARLQLIRRDGPDAVFLRQLEKKAVKSCDASLVI